MSWWRKKSPAPTEASTADAKMPVVRLEGITKIFKGDADEETWALNDITLDIERGEYISVSGPSGCGKSTFLAILALLDTPTRGRYWLNGQLAERMTPRRKPAPAASTSVSSSRASI